MNHPRLLAIIAFAAILGACAPMSGSHPGMAHQMPHGAAHQNASAGQHHPHHELEADRAAATEVLAAYSAAINVEDVVAMEALVIADESFSIIEGGGTDIGWQNYRDHHLGPEFASERIDFHSYAYDNIDVRVGHRFSYATFTYSFEATLDGEPYNKDGRGTAVLQRTDQGWRIRHIQTS